MDIEKKKQAAAEAALDFIEVGDVIGVGTGSTAKYFIDALVQIKGKIDATVASSIASEERLKANGFNVVALSTVSDGAPRNIRCFVYRWRSHDYEG